MAYLDLVPIHLSDGHIPLDRLGYSLEKTFKLRPRIRPAGFDPDTAWNPDRNQYNSSLLLALLLESASHDARRVLGVAGVDLFIPILTFVFGEAQVNGPVAIVSEHRLDPEVYGLEANHEQKYRRLVTESVHELGHTFGLLHCLQPGCVMHASNYVEEIDLKRSTFCTNCQAGLRVLP
jgi:archaemetzincin